MSDLISRKWLIDAIRNRRTYLSYEDAKDVIDLINNAPTVFSCNACKNMGNERECVDCHDYSNYVHYEERPQGEWITKNLEKPYGKCNQCGEICEIDNYCGNCGAKMEGGAV